MLVTIVIIHSIQIRTVHSHCHNTHTHAWCWWNSNGLNNSMYTTCYGKYNNKLGSCNPVDYLSRIATSSRPGVAGAAGAACT